MGESRKAEIPVYSSELESFSGETPGGRIHIRWDTQASVTPNAQPAFFADFLATAGLYESWVSSCPLAYSGGIASHKRDVLGTCFLSILAGHHRYAHIRLAQRRVSLQILGMSKIVSENSGAQGAGSDELRRRARNGFGHSFWPACRERLTRRGYRTLIRPPRPCSAGRVARR